MTFEIHQHGPVVDDQRRRFEERVDPREFVDLPEQRNRAVREGNSCGNEGDGDAPHIWRIEHTDQLHLILIGLWLALLAGRRNLTFVPR